MGNNLLLRRRLNEGQLVITLEQNKDQAYYNQFYQDWEHNGYLGVTPLWTILDRKFAQGKWELLCLPFNVNKAIITALSFSSRVSTFARAAYQNGQWVLYFALTDSFNVGQCYMVNANAKLAQKSKFGYLGRTITSPTVEPDDQLVAGIDLSDVEGFDKLPGTNSSGDMEIVGTLRAGNLRNRPDYKSPNNYYLFDKNNVLKIVDLDNPNGNRILAYQGVFRIPRNVDPANPPN